MRHALPFSFLALLLVRAGTAAAQPLVVIDPGHGGSDPGAVGCSVEEADAVLDVSQRLQVLLERDGVRVALTRDSDSYVGLSARAAFANARSATGFVSIHSNANSGTPATGTETFVYPGSNARTRALGSGVQAAMLEAWGLRDRGLKEANFAVLRETTMPAALGELAFTNNCTTDAPFLRDPAARQRMAEELREAVLDWLGVTPTPTPTTGTLRGVVFEDQGVGTEDLTVRLPGASVRVVETGASASAAAGDAAWSFTLPPGEYTVEASIGGHVTASRRCAVMGGTTTWCSIGLLPESAPAMPDAGVPEPEEDAGMIDVEPMPERDAGAGEVRADGGTPGPGREPVETEGGCAVGGRSSGPGAWASLLVVGLVLALRRRRAWALLAAVVALGCAREAAPAAETSALEDRTSARGEVVTPARIGATPVASLATLGERREWLAEGFVAPVLSPEGTHALLASPDHTALYVLELRARAGGAREICRVGRCGWEPRWQDGGAAIAFRTEGQSGTAVPAEAITLAGERTEVRVGERGVHAWTDDDDRAWLRVDGRTREVGPEGERVMMPALTADGRHVVMWGLSEGVLVHRVADGAIVRVGPGGHPRVDPSGRWLVFERSEDDGHEITASDLYVADLGDPSYPVAPLVTSAERLERMPSLSRIGDDGVGTLAYLEEGVLVVREVRLGR